MQKQGEKLSPDAIEAAGKWLDANAENLPENVTTVFGMGLKVFDVLDNKTKELRSLLTSLRRAMGIIPKSERQKSGTKLNPKSKSGTSEQQQQTHLDLADWHRNLARQHIEKAKKIGEEVKAEDIPLSPEELAQTKREVQEHAKRAELGGGADPSFSQPQETLMAGREHQATDYEVAAEICASQIPTNAEPNSEVFYEERERFGLSIGLERLSIQVEKRSYILPSGDTILIAGKTSKYGPPGMKVTWGFLSNMTILTAMYAIPFNRFGLLASTDDQEFSGSAISRYFRYVAGRLLPVYLEFIPALANSEILAGDDTTARVLEVIRELALLKEASDHEAVWSSFADMETANNSIEKLQREHAKPSLSLIVAAELGFVSPHRANQDSPKQGFNTTVVSGKANANDPASAIIFYRSHLGGFANLMERILLDRKTTNTDLVIQSDLATTNIITDPCLVGKFNIQQAGCASHARRPFAQNIEEDPDRMERLVHDFLGLYINERTLELYGRNRENVAAVRREDSVPVWETIKTQCQDLVNIWPKTHPIGRGARYVIKNYPKLTYYIEDPRVAMTNDFSERMVRMEKLIEDTSLFRQSIEGRCALDIVRSVLQTAVAAGLPVQRYLDHVLQTPPEKVDEDPVAFLPMNCSQLVDSD